MLRDPLLRRFNMLPINQELDGGHRIKHLYFLRKLMRYRDLDHGDLDAIITWIKGNYSWFMKRDYLITSMQRMNRHIVTV